MIGKLLSTTVKVITLPIDIVDATLDVASGGDGSRQSRDKGDSPLNAISDVRDAVCKTIEEIDK